MPGGRIDDVREGGAEPPGAGLAEARDRAVDEIRLHRGERLVVGAQARGDAGREVLDDDVGRPRQVEDDRAGLGAGEVEADALLARIAAHEVGALVLAVCLELVRTAAHLVAASGLLDLDDARAEIGEEARAVRAREHAREVEDDEAGRAMGRRAPAKYSRVPARAGREPRARARLRAVSTPSTCADLARSERTERTPWPSRSTPSTPAPLGLDPQPLERLGEIITGHLAEGRYPGAQIAVARRGQLALFRSFGEARLEPTRGPAREDTLWLMYSNTKVITACAVWILAERGALRYTDRVADHVPGFEANGKGDITIIQLLTPPGRASPMPTCPKEAWTDHDLLRRTVCGFTLEWTPGSRVHLSRPRRALDGGGHDRGADQDGLPCLHPRERHRAARPGRRALRGPARRASMPARWTCTSRRPTGARQVEARGGEQRRSSAARARRAAAATPRPGPWRPSTRCWCRAGR